MNEHVDNNKKLDTVWPIGYCVTSPDFDPYMLILIWQSACDYAGSRDFALVDDL